MTYLQPFYSVGGNLSRYPLPEEEFNEGFYKITNYNGQFFLSHLEEKEAETIVHFDHDSVLNDEGYQHHFPVTYEFNIQYGDKEMKKLRRVKHLAINVFNRTGNQLMQYEVDYDSIVGLNKSLEGFFKESLKSYFKFPEASEENDKKFEQWFSELNYYLRTLLLHPTGLRVRILSINVIVINDRTSLKIVYHIENNNMDISLELNDRVYSFVEFCRAYEQHLAYYGFGADTQGYFERVSFTVAKLGRMVGKSRMASLYIDELRDELKKLESINQAQ